MAQVEIQNILSKTFQGNVPQPRSPVSEITSVCMRQSIAGGIYAFIKMQFLFEGEQSRFESKSYFWKEVMH